MDFAEHCLNIVEGINGHYRLCEQLEAASASVTQNIAEGNGRVSTKEYIHFFVYIRGSLYESITILNLLERKGIINNEKLNELESLGLEIVKMLNSLIAKQRGYL
ncbi:four helix bundle protein [Carboxylicivirga sp. A043]|uniref:four helix bundle protein n=1 Tax=Carboxylicivirga litoralis TaxID=2816963 RepID=UPI003967DA77|nr:four helix bundle protein [Carboxylicivirga sp. A043]